MIYVDEHTDHFKANNLDTPFIPYLNEPFFFNLLSLPAKVGEN